MTSCWSYLGQPTCNFLWLQGKVVDSEKNCKRIAIQELFVVSFIKGYHKQHLHRTPQPSQMLLTDRLYTSHLQGPIGAEESFQMRDLLLPAHSLGLLLHQIKHLLGLWWRR